MHDPERIRAQVRDRYALVVRVVGTSGRELLSRTGSCCASASCCAPTADIGTDVDKRLGVNSYTAGDVAGVPDGVDNVEFVKGTIEDLPLSRAEYLDGLARAGFRDTSIGFNHEVAPGMQGAVIRAAKPTVEATR